VRRTSTRFARYHPVIGKDDAVPPPTVDRVPRNTSEDANRRIQRETDERVRHYATNPTGIDRRLRELDEEWDIERFLETNASGLAFTGIVLGVTIDKRWLALSAFVTAFLFQHAVQGWCPPVPILRRFGYRTAREIDIERVALKALRGDFGQLGPGRADHDSRASHALQAARI
jgi:hypothetical protein